MDVPAVSIMASPTLEINLFRFGYIPLLIYSNLMGFNILARILLRNSGRKVLHELVGSQYFITLLEFHKSTQIEIYIIRHIVQFEAFT